MSEHQWWYVYYVYYAGTKPYNFRSGECPGKEEQVLVLDLQEANPRPTSVRSHLCCWFGSKSKSGEINLEVFHNFVKLHPKVALGHNVTTVSLII